MAGASAEAAHAEIRMRYSCLGRSGRVPSAPPTLTTLRTAELERIFRHRFGGHFPLSREGISALVVMVEHHIQRNRREIVVDWIRARAPWADDLDAEGIPQKAAQCNNRTTAGARAED